MLAAVLLAPIGAQGIYEAVKDPQSPEGIPYARYYTFDRFNRRIAFYISGDQDEPLPIVVSILGSGAYSNFVQREGRILDAHRIDREVFGGKAHLLIVEKPGVAFLEEHPDRGLATQGSPVFRREHTLERWSEAVSAALRATRRLPFANRGRCLVIGHSEGGVVAARVAAENVFVTHVASLAGGGPPLLFDFLELARAGHLGLYYKDLPSDPKLQVARLLADVADIQSDPDNPDKFYLGHPYRRWSTFWSSSTLEELLKTKAQIFIAQGTADMKGKRVPGFDALFATLLGHGKQVTARLVEGADHGFGIADQPNRDGWREMFEDVRDWFFQPDVR
ncbi:alpha/beta fold hydrolase [uncultured Paludibaculum sp.]|uniref:alpha/beta fold hydrolase n=1 Tax=uncultured Paludibaculum sp. TaxID=1765020 RepID=UPI002AAAF700|nr:alpha/beta fold hydrolase [uncultured Paludibaculum sp.]